jgi:hypothetical protein
VSTTKLWHSVTLIIEQHDIIFSSNRKLSWLNAKLMLNWWTLLRSQPSGMWHHAVWKIGTDVSGEPTATKMEAEGPSWNSLQLPSYMASYPRRL